MNFFKWLGNAGRVSALALLGAGGVAVAGGLGAAALLMSNADDNISYSDLGDLNRARQDNVVYTAGSDIGYNYNGKDEGGGRALISARDVNRVDDAFYRSQEAEQFAMQDREMQRAAAYNTQGVGGLSDGTVSDTDQLGGMFGGSDPADLKKMMANVQGAMSNAAQQAAAAQSGGAQGEPGKEGKPGEKGFVRAATGNWDRNSATQGTLNTRVGGSGGSGSTWTPGGSKDGAAAAVGDALAKAQEQAGRMMEGARLSGNGAGFTNRASFGNPLDSSAGRFRAEGKAGEDRILYAQKVAASTAKNKHREANSLGKGFLDGASTVGGITIAGTGVTTGEGQGSADLGSNFHHNLKAARGQLNNIREELNEREKDGNNLKKIMWITFGITLAMCILIPILDKIPIWGQVAKWIAFGIGCAANAFLGIKIGMFSHKWNYSGVAITATVLGGLGVAGLVWSLVKPTAAGNFFKSVGKLLGIVPK